MANKDLLVGSIVKLSPDTKWFNMPNNPFNVVGEVVVQKHYVRVDWYNGTTNVYGCADSDLILIESP